MVADWIRLAGGMLTIRVRGAELERFLNLCAQQRIMLYRIRRTQMDELRAELTLRDFYRLACVRKRSRCRVHIVRRRGFPFVWNRLRRQAYRRGHKEPYHRCERRQAAHDDAIG